MTTAVVEVPAAPAHAQRGMVYCPICTHAVQASVLPARRGRIIVQPGQRCPRCSSHLDAAVVLRVERAA
jgi:transposase-like protein